MTASEHAERRSRRFSEAETQTVHAARVEVAGPCDRPAETDDLHARGGADKPGAADKRGGADAHIARIAAAQRGLVTRDQLLAAGLGRGAVAHRLTSGRLHRLHRGVYLVGHPVAPTLAHELAAVLTCGEGAILSHRSAAVVWELLRPTDGPEHVTVPAQNRRRRPCLRVHSTSRLGPEDTTTRRGIPITTPSRTVLDLAQVAEQRELARALDEAETRRLIRREALLAVLDREPGHRGAAVLRALIDGGRGGSLTRSEAEERMLALIRVAALPRPRVNARLGRYEVDLLWERERLVVEVDGYAFHSLPSAFERDRLRDAELGSAGYRVMRVTWRQIVEGRKSGSVGGRVIPSGSRCVMDASESTRRLRMV
ncbi:MAG: DUF559 domain-containing protein [Thermoleophilaceae bacterium]|jgi:hypothetical protein|nr:DUF559 domain-containing protein [Thermoleophilaceae bacterium]